MRDMTANDKARLDMHRGSAEVFRMLLEGTNDGRAQLVALLSPSAWNLLKRLVELGFVDIEDGRCIVTFTVSSLVRMGYLG